MYCSHLWCDFKNETLTRLILGYNHSFHIIMKYPRHCSASGMFVFNNVPSLCGAKVFMVLGSGLTTLLTRLLTQLPPLHFKFPVEKTLANCRGLVTANQVAHQIIVNSRGNPDRHSRSVRQAPKSR